VRREVWLDWWQRTVVKRLALRAGTTSEVSEKHGFLLTEMLTAVKVAQALSDSRLRGVKLL
jgi:hypothetical protein